MFSCPIIVYIDHDNEYEYLFTGMQDCNIGYEVGNSRYFDLLFLQFLLRFLNRKGKVDDACVNRTYH